MILRATLFAACLACTTAACASTARPAGESRDLAACYDAQVAQVPFSGVVLLDFDGEVFVRTDGYADLAGTVPIERDMRFRLASVTKLITRAAIGRLIDAGRIALDAPVGRYLDGLPAPMAQVTIEQLLDHRSGVANLRYIDDADYARFAAARTQAERLPFITSVPLEFAPGEREVYSNGGFLLLGAVIEAVTGQSYADFVREAVYAPIGMDDSGHRNDDRTVVHMTRATSADGTPPLRQGQQPDRWGDASGDTVSTADDLRRFGQALLGDDFLSATTRAEVFQADSPFTIFHDGATEGVETAFIANAEPRAILVMLANRDGPAGELVARALLAEAGLMGSGCTATQ